MSSQHLNFMYKELFKYQKFCQIICWRPVLWDWDPLGNPGSATHHDRRKWQSSFVLSISAKGNPPITMIVSLFGFIYRCLVGGWEVSLFSFRYLLQWHQYNTFAFMTYLCSKQKWWYMAERYDPTLWRSLLRNFSAVLNFFRFKCIQTQP